MAHPLIAAMKFGRAFCNAMNARPKCRATCLPQLGSPPSESVQVRAYAEELPARARDDDGAHFIVGIKPGEQSEKFYKAIDAKCIDGRASQGSLGDNRRAFIQPWCMAE